MLIKNVKVFTEDGRFVPGGIYCDRGKITGIYETDPEEGSGSGAEEQTGSRKGEDLINSLNPINLSGALDAFDAQLPGDQIIDGKGAYAIPGLIDLHLHGCLGEDFCDGTVKAIETIAAYEAKCGVTAIAPATMTLPKDELIHVLKVAAEYNRQEKQRGQQEFYAKDFSGSQYGHCGQRSQSWQKADIVGINMEGPFISPVKKGAQDARNILPCDVQLAEEFLKASEGLVKFIGLAPEESADSLEFIRQMKDQVGITLAHTNAGYDIAAQSIQAGIDHVVHLFNAMPAFHHRDPGVIGAAAEKDNVMAEIICDGVHVHPSMVRAAFSMFGKSRLIFISDSMRGTGMPEGRYTLGGLMTEVKKDRAVLVSDGALAGSVTNLMECVRTAVRKMDIPLETAVLCAARNPAVSLGIYEERGSISVGKKADIVLLSEHLDTELVIKDGHVLS